MAKTVAIVQSSYLPWKGYFDLIRSADEFVLFDDVQYTRRDWRNRNRIKTAAGLKWLTIPVATKGAYSQAIKDTRIDDARWGTKHWNSLVHAYAKAPCFEELAPVLEPLFRRESPAMLSEANAAFIRAICDYLGIGTRLTWSMDYDLPDADPTTRLVAICTQAGADVYLSGPRARDYLQEGQFADAGIAVRYADYSGYPEYPQYHPPFEHHVTILDLLFHAGRRAPRYMTSFPAPAAAGITR